VGDDRKRAKLNANLYDPWSTKLLQHLQASGPQGVHTAETIRSRGINIVTVDNNATNIWWKVRLGFKGLQIQNTLYLSRFLANKESNDAWVLMSFVHETRHLEQGFRTAFSVFGEMEAWQLGFRFYESLPDHGYLSPFVEDLLALPLSHDPAILRQARRLINLDQNGGTSFTYQIKSVLKKERSFSDVYWIYALPLNPLFSRKESPLPPGL
jgi:hypothetical protein